MCMTFTKYHSLGNDYLVYDCNRNRNRNGSRKAETEKETESEAGRQVLSRQAVQAVCHRQTGLGADGILVGPFLTEQGILLQIYNSDGSRTEKSGNGILIFAKYLKDAGYIQKKEFEILVEDDKAGVCNDTAFLYVPTRIRYNNELGTNMTVSMGQLLFTPEAVGCSYHPERRGAAAGELVDVPLDFGNYTYRCTCVSVGNPHCVLPFKTVTKGIVCDVGEKIENSSYFTDGINTQIAQVIDRHNIQIEIYERGAGYTLASGSSACAAAGAMHRMRFVDSKVWVHMPGGKLLVSVDEDWNADMTGEVRLVGSMRLSEEFLLEHGI